MTSSTKPTCKWCTTKNIATLDLYKPSSLFTRMDLIPFLFLYAFDFSVYYSPQIYKDFIQSQMNEYTPEYAHWNFQFLSLNIGIYPSDAEYNSLKCKLRIFHKYPTTHTSYNNNTHHTINKKTISNATVAHVVPPKHCGEDALCTIQINAITNDFYFIFQQIKYTFNQESNQFIELDFPTNKPISFYINSNGVTFNNANSLQEIYDTNEFDIPMPKFLVIFQEHATSPFFVFQMFCVGLWCLDEYWMYSLFTLFMLIVFELMMVKRRMGNMKMIRNMRSKPFFMYVYREHEWHRITSVDIVPSDIISLVRNHTGMSNDPYAVASEQTIVACDVLLLVGTCVVDEALLTGESVPQIKEPIDVSDTECLLDLKGAHKISLISGGTKIVIAKYDGDGGNDDDVDDDEWLFNGIPVPPDNGAIGWVLRTGFHTSQGELLRTILFSTSRVSVNNPEAFVFIAILLCFAIIASSYVLYWGLQDETRSMYKLALNCVMIITSVVPPELPMELSLAVNNSMIKLLRQKIFCTEAFRIPFAGAVEVCCFDKTGTLTSDQFQVVGLTKLNINPHVSLHLNVKDNLHDIIIPNAKKFTFDGAIVVAGCHSLVRLDNSLIGDPLEKSALQAMGWTFYGNVASPVTCNAAGVGSGSGNSGGSDDSGVDKILEYPNVQIWHRFAFNSSLKRMSCIVSVRKKRNSVMIRLVCKGAAEVIGERLRNMPMNYNSIHSHFSRQGFRVLALAWKTLSDINYAKLKDKRFIKSLKRKKLECDLIFAGFLVFACPHKPDSLDSILQLKASSHAVIMITGDHVLTACAVARDLQIATKPLVSLQKVSAQEQKTQDVDHEKYEWFSIDSYYDTDDQKSGIPLQLQTAHDVRQLSKKYSLCLSGKAIKHLRTLYASNALSKDAFTTLILHAVVYARTSPVQKEFILSTLKELGITTLMCGDGTNDVGALKQAHVGVALLSAQAAHQIEKQEEMRRKNIEKKKKRSLSRWPGMKGMANTVDSDDEDDKKQRRQRAEKWDKEESMSTSDLQKKMWDQLMDTLEDDGSGGIDGDIIEAKPVQLGDASIASPFTSKKSTIDATIHIIRQGRCTLVTTLQMYCILALNCLTSAYSLSVLYMEGVKFGDRQMTITGMMIAALFFFVTQSEPTMYLSKQQPHTSVFSPYIIFSLLGQAVTHLSVLTLAVAWSKPHTPTDEETRDPNGRFKPNVLNTVVFLVSTIQNVATFAANYAGYPFMQSLRNNKKLHRTIFALLAICFACGFGYWPSFDKLMQISPLPSDEFRNDLLILMAADFCLVVGWERICRHMFRKKANPAVPLDPPDEKTLADAIQRQRVKYLKEKAKQKKLASKSSPWQMMKKMQAKAKQSTQNRVENVNGGNRNRGKQQVQQSQNKNRNSKRKRNKR